ncbi:Ca2-binding protein [Aureococcus anophagefferens]|nr:Ca2-binding protein [Aureococcus anophagefferens]
MRSDYSIRKQSGGRLQSMQKPAAAPSRSTSRLQSLVTKPPAAAPLKKTMHMRGTYKVGGRPARTVRVRSDGGKFHPDAMSGALERLTTRKAKIRRTRQTKRRKKDSIESRLQIPSLQDYMKLYQPLDSSVCPPSLLNQVERCRLAVAPTRTGSAARAPRVRVAQTLASLKPAAPATVLKKAVLQKTLSRGAVRVHKVPKPPPRETEGRASPAESPAARMRRLRDERIAEDDALDEDDEDDDDETNFESFREEASFDEGDEDGGDDGGGGDDSVVVTKEASLQQPSLASTYANLDLSQPSLGESSPSSVYGFYATVDRLGGSRASSASSSSSSRSTPRRRRRGGPRSHEADLDRRYVFAEWDEPDFPLTWGGSSARKTPRQILTQGDQEDKQRNLLQWLRVHGKAEGLEADLKWLRMLQFWFAALDEDGSGGISIAELEQSLTAIGLVRSHEELVNLVAEYDSDGTGNLGFREFVEVLVNVSETPSNPIARFFDATSSLGEPTELSFPSLCVSYARKRQMQQMLDTAKSDEHNARSKERELKEQIRIKEERERLVLKKASERAHRLAKAANILGLVEAPSTPRADPGQGL